MHSDKLIYCSNYQDINNDFSNPESRVWVFGVPLDMTTSYRKGTCKGPVAIRVALSQTESYDIETAVDADADPGIYYMGEMEIIDDSQETVKRITEEVTAILSKNKTPFMLGGEHSVSVGSVKACKEFFKDIKVIQFDAHGDLRDEYEGSKHNHACVMRRISEIVGKENILEVGIREISKEETENFRDRMLFRNQCRTNRDECIDAIRHFCFGATVYVTIDIDVLDTSIAPGTGTPQPDGLSYNELLMFIAAIGSAKKICGMDIVEVSPLSESNVTEATAAKLLVQTIAKLRRII